jgi:hypothetical protein
MRHAPILVALVAALLSSCGKSDRPVECTIDGLVVIPADASAENRRKWLSENADLGLKRLYADLDDPRGRYATPESLEKAPSCP